MFDILNRISQIESIDHKVSNLDEKYSNIYALQLLSPLLVNKPFLPFTQSSLSPLGIAYVLNDIIINERKTILELGAGYSTIMMARLARENELDIKIYSLENNKEWKDKIENQLLKEKLNSFVELIFAELNTNGENEWYSEENLEVPLKDKLFDLVLVDGPPAYSPQLMFARYPVINYIKEKLNSKFCIIIDDSNREGEKKLVKDLIEIVNASNRIEIGNSISVLTSGIYFNAKPV